MRNFLDILFKNQSLIYKYFLYAASVGCIVFLFPRGGQFKYEFQKGKPWQYENLYAPFDFPIHKSDEELAVEKQSIRDNQLAYYRYDENIAKEVSEDYDNRFQNFFSTERPN
ncbi:MAG: phosphohydrolase, partial [Flavobacteriaceae bacterium]